PFYPGDCSIEENTDRAEQGLQSALADTSAVLDQLVFGKLASADSKVVLIGPSRGGFLSIMLAAQRPKQIGGIVNFVGGWLSISDAWPKPVNERRLDFNVSHFSAAGKSVTAPSLWIYGGKDPNYSETVTRSFFAAYTAGGATAKYHTGGVG